MNDVWKWDIDKFLAESASSAPTPGGGSISAYAGALGASMVCMVANLTVGKEKYKEVEAETKEILRTADQLLNDLKTGLIKDMDVFNSFMDVLKLPKKTEEQLAIREKSMQKVLIEATESPLNVARKSFEVLKLAKRLAPIGNKGAISDAGVAAYLAESSLKSALLSVDINLPRIKDKSYTAKILEEKNTMLAESSLLLEDAIKIVKERL